MRTSFARMLVGGVALWALAPAAQEAQVDPTAAPDALLLDEARRLGWADDPVIASHLARVLDLPPDLAVGEARRLGLLDRDPVVRARLLDRVGRALRLADADDATLAAHIAAFPERFRTPDLLTIALSRARGGAPAPLPLGVPAEGTMTTDRVARDLPRELAEALGPAAPGESGQVDIDGDVWRWTMIDRRPGAVPPLATIRAAALADWRRTTAPSRRSDLLDALTSAREPR